MNIIKKIKQRGNDFYKNGLCNIYGTVIINDNLIVKKTDGYTTKYPYNLPYTIKKVYYYGINVYSAIQYYGDKDFQTMKYLPGRWEKQVIDYSNELVEKDKFNKKLTLRRNLK